MQARSAKKKPIEILVDAGDLEKPFYTFQNSKGKSIKSLKINPKKTYIFSRADEASTHPFYISDRGVNQKSTSAIKIKGDGKHDSGITGDESFQLSFKKKQRSKFMQSGELFFYCSSHPAMVDEFLIKAGSKTSTASGSANSTADAVEPQASASEPSSSESYGSSYGGSGYGSYSYRSIQDGDVSDIVPADSFLS